MTRPTNLVTTTTTTTTTTTVAPSTADWSLNTDDSGPAVTGDFAGDSVTEFADDIADVTRDGFRVKRELLGGGVEEIIGADVTAGLAGVDDVTFAAGEEV